MKVEIEDGRMIVTPITEEISDHPDHPERSSGQ